MNHKVKVTIEREKKGLFGKKKVTEERWIEVDEKTYLDTQVNKAISDDAPCDYFGKVLNQCKSGDLTIGNIADKNELDENLKENAIPEVITDMTVNDYSSFLVTRRRLMAKLIERYYKSL